MKDAVVNRYIGMYVLIAVIAVTLLVTPFNSIDPVNLPKLCLLVIVAFVAAGLVLSKKGFLLDKRYRAPLVVIGAFILQLISVLLIDNRDMAMKFYGTTSRNTGFIAYISLSFLLVASMASAWQQLIKRYVWALIFIGAILAIYGFAQFNGHDFYKFTNAYESNVFGTFGNPNFQSAFMGIAAATALTLAVFSSFKIYYKVALIALVVGAMYNVSLSSQQGYLNFMAGFATALIIYLFKQNRVVTGWAALGMFSFGVVIVFLGILEKGPLAEIISKSSLQARGNYWRGAVNIIFDHPLFGVGMDGFGDWYRRSWSGVNGITDTAHNIPLDIGANGGLPLLLLHLVIIGLALHSIIRVVKRKSEFDVYFTALVAGWVAYQAQSIISINQLGLGVWGWSLTGLIIGYEIISRDSERIENVKIARKGKVVTDKISASALVITFLTSGIGIAIASPPYIAANKFYKALQSGDANVIQPAAYLRPYDRSRFLYVAQILNQNKLEARAIDVLRDASKVYPDSIEVWSQLSTIASAAPEDSAQAKAEMKRLDPFNPDLK